MSSNEVTEYLLSDTNKDYGFAVLDPSSAVVENMLKAKKQFVQTFIKSRGSDKEKEPLK